MLYSVEYFFLGISVLIAYKVLSYGLILIVMADTFELIRRVLQIVGRPFVMGMIVLLAFSVPSTFTSIAFQGKIYSGKKENRVQITM